MKLPETDPWWARALEVVGFPGIAGLSLFAVAAVLAEAYPERDPSSAGPAVGSRGA